MARYYSIRYDAVHKQFGYAVDAEKYDRAERLDGTYLLRTERTDLGAEEAWRLYILLTRAEDAFRDMRARSASGPSSITLSGGWRRILSEVRLARAASIRVAGRLM